MTTAARPTFDPARGGRGKGENDLSALSKQYSSRDMPSHTKLKYRSVCLFIPLFIIYMSLQTDNQGRIHQMIWEEEIYDKNWRIRKEMSEKKLLKRNGALLVCDCVISGCVISDCVISDCVISDCVISDCVICDCVISDCVIWDCVISDCVIVTMWCVNVWYVTCNNWTCDKWLCECDSVICDYVNVTVWYGTAWWFVLVYYCYYRNTRYYIIRSVI